MWRLRGLVIFLVFAWTGVFACQFDSECDLGYRCIDLGGDSYGWCVPVENPYNNDLPPWGDHTEVSQDVSGKSCQVDIDCGYGGKCLIPSGSIYGDCK